MQQIKQGVYRTQGFEIAPVYAVIISELPTDKEGEVEKIRLFQRKNQLDNYLEESILKGRNLKYAFLLYRDRIRRIAKRLGVSMTAIEERARELGWISVEEARRERVKIQKLTEKRERRKRDLQTALKMQQKGCELALIVEITEIPEEKLKRFFYKWQRIHLLKKKNSR
ncbi:MAG: hypothetical protein AAF518_16095 [Spirochaetota bacterium]